MNILEKILEIKRKFLSFKKIQFPIEILEKSRYFNRETYSLNDRISNIPIESGIIAEFKRKSPSKGFIKNYNFFIEKIFLDYKKSGVIGISILNDFHSFKGKEQDFIKTRQIVQIPLLYKDIIIDEYQIILAKSIGSDIILLIAEILSKKKIKTFIQTAKSLGLEVLIELHSNREDFKIKKEISFIGINNRNLKSFFINLNNSIKFSKKIINNLFFSESGILDNYQIDFLHKSGFNGFLIGETLLRAKNPGLYCEYLIKKRNEIKTNQDLWNKITTKLY